MSKTRQTRKFMIKMMSPDVELAKQRAKQVLGTGEWDIEVKFVGRTDAWILATSK